MYSRLAFIIILISFAAGQISPSFAKPSTQTATASSPLASRKMIIDVMPSLKNHDEPTPQELAATLPLIGADIKILKEAGLDTDEFERWWSSPDNQKLAFAGLPWGQVKAQTVGDLVHHLFLIETAETFASDQKTMKGQALDDKSTASAQKLLHHGWSSIDSGVTFGSVLLFLGWQGLKVLGFVGKKVGAEIVSSTEFTVSTKTIATALEPVLGVWLDWLTPHANRILRWPHAKLGEIAAGAQRKAKAAEKKQGQGKELGAQDRVYSVPGKSAKKVGAFFGWLTGVFSMQKSAGGSLLTNEQKANRDHFRNIFFTSTLNFTNTKVSAESAEISSKLYLSHLSDEFRKDYNVPKEELEAIKNLDKRIGNIRFEDQTDPQIEALEKERARMIDSLHTKYNVPKSLATDFGETHLRLLGAREAQAYQLVDKAYFDLTFPEDGRGLTEKYLREWAEAGRESGGVYRAMEEVGARAQQIADRMNLPLDFEALLTARGYGPEEFENSPRYQELIKQRTCLLNFVRELSEVPKK